MANERLDILLRVRDLGSQALDGAARRLSNLDKSIKAADAHFERMRQGWQAAMNGVDWGRQFYDGITRPGLEAAATVQQALAGLQVGLDAMPADQLQKVMNQVRTRAAEIAGPTSFNQGQIIDLMRQLNERVPGLDAVIGKGGVAEAVAQYATAKPNATTDDIVDALVSMSAIGGLKGQQNADAADYLYRASSRGVSTQEYSAALQNMGSASLYGLDPKDLVAALDATAANLNVKGAEAGSSWNTLFANLTRADKKLKLGLMADGSTNLDEVAAALRKATEGKTLAQTQKMLFGGGAFDETARAAVLTLLQEGGDKSLEASRAQIAAARGLSEAVGTMAQGFAAQKEALQGSLETLLANVFTPALGPLSEALSQANAMVGQADAALAARPELNNALATVGAGGAAAGGAVALWQLMRAGGGGASGLMSILRGQGTELANVAAAKAKQAVDGVQPVRVVNWPDSMGGAGLGALPGAAGAAAGAAGAGGLLGKAGKAAGLAGAILAAKEAETALYSGVGGMAGNGTAGKLLGLSMGNMQWIASLGGLLESEDQAKGRRNRQAAGVNELLDLVGAKGLKERLNLTVQVQVDDQGRAFVKNNSGLDMLAASRLGAG